MTQSAGIGVIGPGAIAERHLQALERMGGVLLRWVVADRDDLARDFAARWKFAEAGTSLERALADPLVALVLVATPSPLHSSQAIAALRAGKDVIVEIPVAMSGPDTQAVAQAAADCGRRVWVCHTMRSLPALGIVRAQVQTGRLHLTHIAGVFAIPRRRNQGMEGAGTRTWVDNLLWHHACHQVDASLWVLGMPAVTRVQALFGPAHPTYGMALDLGLQFSAADGTLITHSLSYNVEQPTWRLQFIGHEDVLTFDHGRLTNEAGQELTPEARSTDCTAQDRAILHAWQTGGPCEYDLSGVLATMDVLERAQHSAEESVVAPARVR
jgi:2-hydroxy-4-carboxymuconate semialdehyde hemiacetal dehydrogenase